MRLFLDSANLDYIRQSVKLGVISGVTTNPSLIAKEKNVNFKERIKEICSVVPGPVSTEVISQDVAGIIKEGRDIATWAKNIAVKIPAGLAGIEATKTLSQEGVSVNMTLCFSVNQAILAALAGAAFVSPFVGRLDDIGQDGMVLIKDIVDVFEKHKITTEVVAASIRHPLHCVAAAKAGAPVITVPYDVLMQMVRHPLTDLGINRFIEDWKKVTG